VIPVTLSYLVVIYLALMLGPIFCAWLLNEWRRQRRERAAFRHVLRCTLCAFEFEDKTTATLPSCPRCGCLNERSHLSRL
jgi:predicted RNA-binding Zn-ribbon protein involved in translation (DUF1610 family)